MNKHSFCLSCCSCCCCCCLIAFVVYANVAGSHAHCQLNYRTFPCGEHQDAMLFSLSLQKQKRSLAESTPRRRQQEKRVRASVSKRERGAFVSVATRLSAHFASELCAAKTKVVHRRTAKTTTNRNEARQTPQNFNHKQWKIYSMES